MAAKYYSIALSAFMPSLVRQLDWDLFSDEMHTRPIESPATIQPSQRCFGMSLTVTSVTTLTSMLSAT